MTKNIWDKETIIYAELDMNLPAACKMEHDAISHYARPDVLELKVNEKQQLKNTKEIGNPCNRFYNCGLWNYT